MPSEPLSSEPLKVFGCDALTIDLKVPFDLDDCDTVEKREAREKVAGFIRRMQDRKKVPPYSKIYLDAAEFSELQELAAPLEIKDRFPGGSAINTFDVLQQLAGGYINPSFMSVIEDSPFGKRIRDGMQGTHINFNEVKGNVPSQSAITYDFEEKGLGSTRCVYPGNIGEIITPELVREPVADSQIIFIQGGLWDKGAKSAANQIMTDRYFKNKEVWYALPTQSEFSKEMPAEGYRFHIPSADVVMGNADELKRVYGVHDRQAALDLLQADLRKRDDFRRHDHLPPFHQRPIALITSDADGAFVITPDEQIPVKSELKGEVRNTLGAGDNSFAGFLYALKGRLSPKECGQMAMFMAATKMDSPASRLPNSKKMLKAYDPEAEFLVNKADQNLQDHGCHAAVSNSWVSHSKSGPSSQQTFLV